MQQNLITDLWKRWSVLCFCCFCFSFNSIKTLSLLKVFLFQLNDFMQTPRRERNPSSIVLATSRSQAHIHRSFPFVSNRCFCLFALFQSNCYPRAIYVSHSLNSFSLSDATQCQLHWRLSGIRLSGKTEKNNAKNKINHISALGLLKLWWCRWNGFYK